MVKKREILISGHGINLKAGGRTILDHIDIEINKGEIVTVIGPNGAGKTSLIRVLIGAIKPDSGKIIKAENLVIGYVPQRVNISPLMPITVKRFMSLTKKTSPIDIKSTLSIVGAENLVERQFHSLSGGETQRVLLAHSVLQNPDLLILDEPVQGMDIGGQVRFYTHLERIRKSLGCGVLMVSHDLHMVMAATDKVICIHHHVCCAGEPEKVRQDPALVEMFGEKAVRSLAFYTHEHNHAHDGASNRDTITEKSDAAS